eukprot:839873_1
MSQEQSEGNGGNVSIFDSSIRENDVIASLSKKSERAGKEEQAVSSNDFDSHLVSLAKNLGEIMKQKGIQLTVAESCTGGWLAQVVTSVAGCSTWFERGFVTYSNLSKQEMLGVSGSSLDEHGAVSEVVAREMTGGAIRASHAQVGCSTTGFAGPTGGTSDKPVGTVCLAWEWSGKVQKSVCLRFKGDRRSVREQAVKVTMIMRVHTASPSFELVKSSRLRPVRQLIVFVSTTREICAIQKDSKRIALGSVLEAFDGECAFNRYFRYHRDARIKHFGRCHIEKS